MFNLRLYGILCLFVIVFASPAFAETKIAVVDVQKLLTQSMAAKDIQGQIQSHREKIVKDITQREQELRDIEKELMEKSKDMAPETLAEKKKEFEEKLIKTRQLAQDKKQEMDQAVADAMKVLRDKAYEIVSEIADERKLNLVVSRQNVVIGDKDLDISDETMEKLNKALKSVSLNLK